MSERSKLVRMRITNIGCIGPEGLEIQLDNILCLVGPNNSGKSTILRAYELAYGAASFSEGDLYKQSREIPASVELWVHIPHGTGNVAVKWKSPEDEMLLVRSKWEWHSSPDGKWNKVRSTWDPEQNAFAPDGKAAGLDEVFQSRLPKPLRIGTLEDPVQAHGQLLTLIIQPVADRIKRDLADKDSESRRALDTLSELVNAPVREEREKLAEIRERLNSAHNKVFSNLTIDFEVGLGDIPVDPTSLLRNNSHLKFIEGTSEVRWDQQGTGSQRTLFWTLLQVRSELDALSNMRKETEKRVSDIGKSIAKLEKEMRDRIKEDTKQKKQEEIDKLLTERDNLISTDPKTRLSDQSAEFALPGYMLLIDEPEVGLHPNAIRAACEHLYGLADDPAWQVMIATHSPEFINPLYDHTTIVRLSRSSEGDASPTPKTYKSDSIQFSSDEKEKLKMLNRFDLALAEMFFGSYPIVIEGDTEFAAFETLLNLQPDLIPTRDRPLLVRARGKWTMLLVARMLRHFKVPFSILHDTDGPRQSRTRRNGAWKANSELHDELQAGRTDGIRIVHRLSMPTFEDAHLRSENQSGEPVEFPKADKPWYMRERMINLAAVRDSVRECLTELLDPNAQEEPFIGNFENQLMCAVKEWAEKNAPSDERYVFD